MSTSDLKAIVLDGTLNWAVELDYISEENDIIDGGVSFDISSASVTKQKSANPSEIFIEVSYTIRIATRILIANEIPGRDAAETRTLDVLRKIVQTGKHIQLSSISFTSYPSEGWVISQITATILRSL
jgi:hypothetical protein